MIFEEVVHSMGTREADCAEAITSEEKMEWTPIRMPDLPFGAKPGDKPKPGNLKPWDRRDVRRVSVGTLFRK